MKMMKNLLAVIVAVCLIMSLSVPVFATGAESASESTPAASDTESVPVESVPETAGAAETPVDVHAGHDHGESNKTLKVILTVLEVIASVALAVIVLMQSGKESGLSGAISGNSDSYMSKGKGGMDKMLAKSTKWVALVWLLLTLSLSLI